MASSFLVFRSSFCSSSWCQLTIPKLYLSIGTANDPVAWILFFALNCVPKTNLNLLKYAFFSFSFSFLCWMSKFSSMPKYLYAFLSVPCTWYPQSALFSSFVNGMSAMQNSNGERESPWNIPLRIWMGYDCITSCFVLKKSLVFHFSIDSLQNLTIFLFTPTNSIDFSTQLCGTLSNAFW